jgi:hypothetical protein
MFLIYFVNYGRVLKFGNFVDLVLGKIKIPNFVLKPICFDKKSLISYK